MLISMVLLFQEGIDNSKIKLDGFAEVVKKDCYTDQYQKELLRKRKQTSSKSFRNNHGMIDSTGNRYRLSR